MPGFVKTPLTDKNDFPMPNLISAEETAREIIGGLRAGEFEICFPRAFTRKLKLLRLLPHRVYFPLIAEGDRTVSTKRKCRLAQAKKRPARAGRGDCRQEGIRQGEMQVRSTQS